MPTRKENPPKQFIEVEANRIKRNLVLPSTLINEIGNARYLYLLDNGKIDPIACQRISVAARTKFSSDDRVNTAICMVLFLIGLENWKAARRVSNIPSALRRGVRRRQYKGFPVKESIKAIRDRDGVRAGARYEMFVAWGACLSDGWSTLKPAVFRDWCLLAKDEPGGRSLFHTEDKFKGRARNVAKRAYRYRQRLGDNEANELASKYYSEVHNALNNRLHRLPLISTWR